MGTAEKKGLRTAFLGRSKPFLRGGWWSVGCDGVEGSMLGVDLIAFGWS